MAPFVCLEILHVNMSLSLKGYNQPFILFYYYYYYFIWKLSCRNISVLLWCFWLRHPLVGTSARAKSCNMQSKEATKLNWLDNFWLSFEVFPFFFFTIYLQKWKRLIAYYLPWASIRLLSFRFFHLLCPILLNWSEQSILRCIVDSYLHHGLQIFWTKPYWYFINMRSSSFCYNGKIFVHKNKKKEKKLWPAATPVSLSYINIWFGLILRL